MRIWFKVWKNAHLISDVTIENLNEDTRTHKIFDSLQQACNELDLGQPVWLDKNVSEFKKNSKTRFTSDNFIEEIEFDYLELHVLEEDIAY